MGSYPLELTRSFKTLQEMLVDRGHTDSEFVSMCPEDALAYAAGRYTFHMDDPKVGYRIIYELNSRFKLNNIRKLLDPGPSQQDPAGGGSASHPLRVFVVVVRELPTAAAKKSIQELHLDVQFFDVRELQYNVTKHDLVPSHHAIRDEAQIQGILDSLCLRTRTQLPLILSSDPVARYLGLKPGQVVRVTRNSPSAGTYMLYRCCVKGGTSAP